MRLLGSQNTDRRIKIELVEILNLISHRIFKGQDNITAQLFLLMAPDKFLDHTLFSNKSLKL